MRRCAAACIASASSRRGTRQARSALQREIGAAVHDAIEIVALPRREARIETVRRPSRRQAPRPDAAADARSRASRTLVGAPVLLEIDMRDLSERMHARIGAAGARDLDGCGRTAPSIASVERALHGRRVVLPLPAGERRAVIFDESACSAAWLSRVRRRPQDSGPGRRAAHFVEAQRHEIRARVGRIERQRHIEARSRGACSSPDRRARRRARRPARRAGGAPRGSARRRCRAAGAAGITAMGASPTARVDARAIVDVSFGNAA